MTRSIPALIHPSLLVWARKNAGLRPEEAAAKAGINPQTLQEWEAGTDRPSIPQLRKLGEVYKRPLAVFFLPEPPKGFDPQREFRRLAGISPQAESPKLRLALRMALLRREVAREIYERLGEPIPAVTASVHPAEDPEIVGQRLRDLLGITWQTQVEWPNPYAALNGWRDAIERVGVLVFQTGGVDLKEMRGTGISSGPLPVILLNNADAPHGRIFTLLHEFVHILLANGGHRTSVMEGKRFPEDQVLENASNRFAAAALMPKSELLAEASEYPKIFNGEERELRRLANRIKASPEAILRRLVSLHRVPADVYERKRKAWLEHPWFPSPQSEGGPPIETKVIAAVGRSFVSLILEGYQRNAISSASVSDCLGVQLKYLDRIAGELVT